ncbi:MAG: hypothetical protein OXP71_04865 [Candidatus Poribacteria bacterium]|nr:hypothetical protein [Candidatus Poribacteria bacterium]
MVTKFHFVRFLKIETNSNVYGEQKLFAQLIRSLLWLSSFCIVLIVVTIGCGGGEEDDNEWVGTWEWESVDGESVEQAFGEEGVDVSIVTNNWTFDSNGTMEVEIAMKFEAKEEGLELSGQGSVKMTGTYTLSGSNYTLTPIEVEGTGIFKEEVEPVGATDEDAGTWSRSVNTLTLISEDGFTIVFKKK